MDDESKDILVIIINELRKINESIQEITSSNYSLYDISTRIDDTNYKLDEIIANLKK